MLMEIRKRFTKNVCFKKVVVYDVPHVQKNDSRIAP